jgi:hypothetical protein
MRSEATRRAAPRTGAVKRAVLALLLLIFAQRLVILLACPDLLHDWDAGELKHMDLALFGLPATDGALFASVQRWLSAPENIHHGGFVVLSLAYAAASAVIGHSLLLLRAFPLAASTAAAALGAAFVHRRLGSRATLLLLALFLGAPPILMKWSLTARGGHTEAILLVPLLAVLLDSALRDDRPWRWGLAGAVAGFSVYFTYLAAPAAALLVAAAIVERAIDRGERWTPGQRRAVGAALVGLTVGFSPWLFGWLILDLPYLDATVHASARPDEASEVLGRGLFDLARGAVTGLPHNLWPWTVGTATAAAYAAEVPDQLDYAPTVVEWTARAMINVAVLAGIRAAWRRRSPLLLSLCLLPGLHYLFVMRLANQGGWPEVPHRYLVIAWPAIVMASVLGVCELRSAVARRAGAAGLLAVALAALTVTIGWLGAPAPSIDIEALRDNSIGRVRASEAESMVALLARLDAEDSDHQQAARRGVGLIYSSIADYFLLFRRTPERPYPERLFEREDPLSDTPARRDALARGALDATILRAVDDAQRDRFLCSWAPRPEYEAAVQHALASRGVDLRCP